MVYQTGTRNRRAHPSQWARHLDYFEGKGEYYLDKAGTTKSIVAGDVVIAHTGCVHGVLNNSDEPLVFISVVSPADAGYQLVSEDSFVLHP
ncbi:cupin domain-containing protein [Phormidesmis priestleyi]|uniref:cupin domain-containing protein n=1 Tax=Phormidesmis priestleyi TaxID=268141 RepID=UPI0037C9C45C